MSAEKCERQEKKEKQKKYETEIRRCGGLRSLGIQKE